MPTRPGEGMARQQVVPAAGYASARREECTAREVCPGGVPGQPARYERGGSFEICEMRDTEGDQRQAVQRPRDTHTAVPGGELEAPSVPVSGEPRIQHP